MIGSPFGPGPAQSAQSHDWDDRATEVIAEARKMPPGKQRSDALGEAGRLRIAAEMKRWLSTKQGRSLPEPLVVSRQYIFQKRAILNSDSRAFEIRLTTSSGDF
jgi:hypothetical protein